MCRNLYRYAENLFFFYYYYYDNGHELSAVPPKAHEHCYNNNKKNLEKTISCLRKLKIANNFCSGQPARTVPAESSCHKSWLMYKQCSVKTGLNASATSIDPCRPAHSLIG